MRKFKKIMIYMLITIAALILVKVIWVVCGTWGFNGSPESEKSDIMGRRAFLIDKVVTTPQNLIDEMPSIVGQHFQGEWAIYSCSMTAMALANIADMYPETRQDAITNIDKIVEIIMSDEVKWYDAHSWGEDPLVNMETSRKDHMSYRSLLAWAIGSYKRAGGDGKYDALYHKLCETMNRQVLESPNMNLRTFPGNPVFVPDMLVTYVALAQYARFYNGKYQSTVNKWVKMARASWLEKKTGLLAAYLPYHKVPINASNLEVRGSYIALSVYYLSLIDPDFAREQYDLMKQHFVQTYPVPAIKEFTAGNKWLAGDIDAGPVFFNLSPSGTAFAVGPATYFEDYSLRSKLLTTAEIAGHSWKWGGKKHYLIAKWALVGEAITLAMKTTRAHY